METLDFSIYQDKKLVPAKEIVQLQAGKGKEANSSIYIASAIFEFVEGVIWERHREYGNSRKSKIHDSDWKRINEGFSDAIKELEQAQNPKDLTTVLQVSTHQEVFSLEDVFAKKAELQTLFKELITWIESKSSSPYIMVLKNI